MAVIPIILLNGTTADANDVMADFNEIYTNIDNTNIAANAAIAFSKLAALNSARILVGSAGNVATSVPMTGAVTISNTGVTSLSASGGGGSVPVGTVIPFQDFGGIATFDTTYWKMCDGTMVVNVSSILNGQTTTDMSGRAPVGFGTDGGGDIGTAPWATAAVGNPGNIINIQHNHTNTHHHQFIHTHDMANHTHPVGTYQFQVADISVFAGPVEQLNFYKSDGTSVSVAVDNGSVSSGNTTWDQNDTTIQSFYTKNGSGSSGVPSTNTTGGPSSNNTDDTAITTSDALSTTQSIQPISIRFRFLLRVL